MNYSEKKVATLYNEDFTGYFIGNIGSGGARMDALTIVRILLYRFEEAEKTNRFLKLLTVFL